MTKFIVPIIVGAVIGYITNWLAIKMLFRPHKEMRFLGFKIPFTPGLIPKEKDRIAKSVGETVGNHLLSPEMIIDSLNDEEVTRQVEKWIDQRIESFKSSDDELRVWVKSLVGNNYDKVVQGTEFVLNAMVIRELQKEENQTKLVKSINKMMFNENIVGSDFYIAIREKVKQFISNPGFSESAKTAIKAMMFEVLKNLKSKDVPLKDIVSPSISNSLKVYIYNHKQEMADFLRDILNDDKVHDKLKADIAMLIELNFGKLVTMFMNPENTAIKIIIAIINYLGKPENQDNIALIGVRFVDILLEKRVKEIFEEIPDEIEEQLIEDAALLISDFTLREHNQNFIISVFEDKIIENEEVIRQNIYFGMTTLIKKIVDSIEFKSNLSMFIHEGIGSVLSIKLSEITAFMSEPGIISVKALIMDTIKNFINNKAGELANLLNVEKIVEDRINSFEVEFAEKLILDVAKKELSAITWLGALLGAIMGIISPIIEILTR